jgi:nitronate monooxygenase
MFPCSNPELVAAASEAGGIGVVQPVSLTFVHGHEYRTGLRYIRSLTSRPIGMNALIEQSSRLYRERMERWIDISLEEGIRFFVTSLGNPRWVVDKVSPHGGVVYHDVTERKWALKGVDGGVHGLIAVNKEAGGHAGPRSPAALYDELADLGLPLICAGGVGDAKHFRGALDIGYSGVQMGTRFIATVECYAHPDYKQAILRATADDIVLTERLTGVPVAVIRNEYINRIGTKAGPIARYMLRRRRTKHLMRTIYALKSLRALRRSLNAPAGERDYWQAGRSVAQIHEIKPAGEIVRELAAVL